MESITVGARAKVNLYLHVVGKRADGYHLLDSLIAFADIGDTVRVEPAAGLGLTIDGPTAFLLPAGEENIVEKAARALAARAGVTAGAHIHLTKRLPVAAGIGGGSADAAAALTALAQLWRVSLPEPEMMGLALLLGADVPVCLAGRATAVAGIGEDLAPAPALPSAWLLLANPMLPCPTPAVFRARQGPFSSPAPLAAACPDARSLADSLAARRNDLGEAAVAIVPEIGDLLTMIAAQPGCLLARMSGSGATCFGLFADPAPARAAATAIEAAHPDWWTAAAALVG